MKEPLFGLDFSRISYNILMVGSKQIEFNFNNLIIDTTFRYYTFIHKYFG